MFLACLAFVLLVAGGLVTSNNAGLSVPDWPTSFGSLYKMPRMVGGVKFEHGHRMLADLLVQGYRYSGEPAQVLPFSRNREVASA